jgi:hypothetical protein
MVDDQVRYPVHLINRGIGIRLGQQHDEQCGPIVDSRRVCQRAIAVG